MNLREELNQFYKINNIPPKGGVELSTFEVPLPIFTLKLPNLSWRKKMLYIHDLEHILNQQDTTWKGEMYIAAWEVSTGFWKNFPLIIFPLWTMGWGIWKHPQVVIKGFWKGNTNKGIANLNIPEEKLMEMNLSELKTLTNNNRSSYSFIYFTFKFTTWLLTSQIVFWSPLIILFVLLFNMF